MTGTSTSASTTSKTGHGLTPSPLPGMRMIGGAGSGVPDLPSCVGPNSGYRSDLLGTT